MRVSPHVAPAVSTAPATAPARPRGAATATGRRRSAILPCARREAPPPGRVRQTPHAAHVAPAARPGRWMAGPCRCGVGLAAAASGTTGSAGFAGRSMRHRLRAASREKGRRQGPVAARERRPGIGSRHRGRARREARAAGMADRIPGFSPARDSDAPEAMWRPRGRDRRAGRNAAMPLPARGPGPARRGLVPRGLRPRPARLPPAARDASARGAARGGRTGQGPAASA